MPQQRKNSTLDVQSLLFHLNEYENLLLLNRECSRETSYDQVTEHLSRVMRRRSRNKRRVLLCINITDKVVRAETARTTFHHTTSNRHFQLGFHIYLFSNQGQGRIKKKRNNGIKKGNVGNIS